MSPEASAARPRQHGSSPCQGPGRRPARPGPPRAREVFDGKEDTPRARAVPRLGAALEKVKEALDAPGLLREVLSHEDRLGSREVAAAHEEPRPLERGDGRRAHPPAPHPPKLRGRRVELPELLERGAEVE